MLTPAWRALSGYHRYPFSHNLDLAIYAAWAAVALGRWEFAYYSAGYAVECALKSCLLVRMIHTAWIFEEKWKAQDCLTHDFGELVRLSGLIKELNEALAASAAAGGEFVGNWATATQWKVTSRYEARTEAEAKGLHAAITDNPHGVLKWVQNSW
ncbi:MAG: hypothetical protein ACRC33_27880 [Gemmataceae bacterium]